VRRNVLGALIVLAAAAVIVLLPAYLDNQWRREDAMKNCAFLSGMALDSTFCEQGFITDGRTLERFPVVTAREKLLELGASWDRGVLRDASGREIRFFRVIQFGNPPSNWDEIEKRSFEQLQKLEERYHVVEMYATRGAI
jgi:hypothetical protein